MDLKANAYTCIQNKRGDEQNTHQETTNMDEEHIPAHTHVDRKKRNSTKHTSMNTQHASG